MKKPLRILKSCLSDRIYATRAYKDNGKGTITVTGTKEDVTNDVRAIMDDEVEEVLKKINEMSKQWVILNHAEVMDCNLIKIKEKNKKFDVYICEVDKDHLIKSYSSLQSAKYSVLKYKKEKYKGSSGETIKWVNCLEDHFERVMNGANKK